MTAYFYYHPEAPDQTLDVLDSNEGTHLIGAAAQGGVQLDIKRGRQDFTDACFQLENGYFQFDEKGSLTELSKKPSWAKTSQELDQIRLIAEYGLEQVSFMEGIEKLSRLDADKLSSILSGLLPNLELTSKTIRGAKSGQQVDQKPRVTTLDEDAFGQFYKLMNEAVKTRELPSMDYFINKAGLNNAELKRGYRTFYRAVVGENMKPRDANPKEEYFQALESKLKLINGKGVSRAYNEISTKLKEHEQVTPISELPFHLE